MNSPLPPNSDHKWKIPVCRPHAALRTLSQKVAVDRRSQHGRWQAALAIEVSPRRRTWPGSPARLPTLGKREIASRAIFRRLPLRLRDLKPDQSRDPVGALEKPTRSRCSTSRKTSPFASDRGSNQPTPLIGDDDDLAATAELDRPPCAFLRVYRKPGMLKHRNTTDLLAQRFYLSSLHFSFRSRERSPLICELYQFAASAAAKSKGRKGAAGNLVNHAMSAAASLATCRSQAASRRPCRRLNAKACIRGRSQDRRRRRSRRKEGRRIRRRPRRG